MNFYAAQYGYLYPAMTEYGSSSVGMVIGFPKVIFNSVVLSFSPNYSLVIVFLFHFAFFVILQRNKSSFFIYTFTLTVFKQTYLSKHKHTGEGRQAYGPLNVSIFAPPFIYIFY
jgi:hypothetical protein